MGNRRWDCTTRLLGMAMLLCARGYGESPAHTPSEYQVKATYLYNFVNFVAWPGGPAEQQGPIVLCVIGKDPFKGALDRAGETRTSSGRPFAFRQIYDPAAGRSCHVLFVSASESKHLPAILNAVRAWSVLTVSEIDGFFYQGGMITFLMEGDRVRFQINSSAAGIAHLKVSSKLLQLAMTPDDKKRD